MRTQDRDEAESVVAETFLPNSIEPLGPGQLDVRLEAFQLGLSTVGMLSYGAHLRLRTDDANHYHVNLPVRGVAISRMGARPAERTVAGRAAVFMPSHPAEIEWTQDCVQLCLMIPASVVEKEIEELTGRSVRAPLEFEPAMDLFNVASRGWRQTLQVLIAEFEDGPGIASHPRVARQLERVVVDGLLLGHRHTYSDVLAGGRWWPSSPTVARAIQLLQEQPERVWSASVLAREVHSSVRALQEGFARETGVPPMTYLRQVRLRRARDLLLEATPLTATVTEVATGLGFTHLGRFAAAYRDEHGEPPSAALRR